MWPPSRFREGAWCHENYPPSIEFQNETQPILCISTKYGLLLGTEKVPGFMKIVPPRLRFQQSLQFNIYPNKYHELKQNVATLSVPRGYLVSRKILFPDSNFNIAYI